MTRMPAKSTPAENAKGARSRPDLRSAAELFKTLGELDRLRLYHLLLSIDEEICVCELVDAVGIPQYQVSRHLQSLRRTGLLFVHRRGTWAYYSAVRAGAVFDRLAATVKDLCTDEVFTDDKARLAERLALRAGGRCVVGFVESRGTARTKGDDGSGGDPI